MEKQYTPEKQKPIVKNEKIVTAPIKQEVKKEEKHEHHPEESKEVKPEEKKDKKKQETSETLPVSDSAQKSKSKKISDIVKKDKAIMNGNDLPISKKHSMAICDYIRGKTIEPMIADLEKVVTLARPIPMKGEIPHRHGNIMSGRYPVNASKVFIKLLKTLNANCSVNGLENPIIKVAIANDASRPFRRGGSMRFKRTNVYLEARDKIMKENKK